MKYLNIFLAILLVFSFICPAFASSADWYMVQEAYAVANGRDWFIADMEGYGLVLFVGSSSNAEEYYFYFFNDRSNPPNWYGWIVYGYITSSGGWGSVGSKSYSWDGSGWNSVRIADNDRSFIRNNHRVLYSTEDIVYYPERDQVFFSRMLPPRPLDLGEIMEESPVLPTMMTVGGVVSGPALMIFGILLVISLVVYLVRWWLRLRA